MASPLHTLSAIIGWFYFAAWSISFYPQAILNFRRKSVQGLSIDFLSYNVLGFLCYSIYNLAFYSSETARNQYKDRNNGQSNLVRLNDVVFSLHAFIISTFTLCQAFYYQRDENQKTSKFALSVMGVLLSAIFMVIVASSANWIQWIDLLYFLSIIKLILSLIKYCPQVYINFKRKSTQGWSIHNILLDFTGGVLSIGQLFLDASIDNNWGGVFGNPAKLLLGNVSILFDILFIVQHYILYRHRSLSAASSVSELGLPENLTLGANELPPKKNGTLLST